MAKTTHRVPQPIPKKNGARPVLPEWLIRYNITMVGKRKTENIHITPRTYHKRTLSINLNTTDNKRQLLSSGNNH